MPSRVAGVAFSMPKKWAFFIRSALIPCSADRRRADETERVDPQRAFLVVLAGEGW